MGLIILDGGIDFLAEVVYSLVLKPHGIEHTRRRLGHTGIGVAFTVVEGGTLDDDTAKAVEVYKIGKLGAVTKCARCCHHRVGKFELAYRCS